MRQANNRIFWWYPFPSTGSTISKKTLAAGFVCRYLGSVGTYSVILHLTDTWPFESINFSEPLNFQAIKQQNNHSAEEIQCYLTTQLLQQREATFGPQVTSLKMLTARVLETEIVQQAIEKMALDVSESSSVSKTSNSDKISAKAKGYCTEMFADCTQISRRINITSAIDVLATLLHYF